MDDTFEALEGDHENDDIRAMLFGITNSFKERHAATEPIGPDLRLVPLKRRAPDYENSGKPD
jgi:hypothetical protein